MRPMQNRHNDIINDSIQTIIAFLKDRYGKISYPQVMEKDRELLALVWDTIEQPDAVFNEVEEYVDLCEMIKQPLHDRKKVQFLHLSKS